MEINNFRFTLKPSLSSSIHLFFFILFATLAFLPINSQAATFTVSNTNDSGADSLRQAVQDANTLAGSDTIIFDPTLIGSTITINGEITISDSLTITGPIAGDDSGIIIDANYASRHFNGSGFALNSGESITLEHLSLINGSFQGTGVSSDNLGGGSLFIKNADLSLNHVLLYNNQVIENYTSGGAVYINSGDLSITHSSISGNTIQGDNSNGGGAFIKYGALNIDQSSFQYNKTLGSTSMGAGLYLTSLTNTAFISQTTFSRNSTSGSSSHGGGIFSSYARVNLNQVTISGNLVTGVDATGGGYYIFGQGTSGSNSTIITQSTIANNSSTNGAGGISHRLDQDLTLENTILSGNTGPEGNFEDRVITVSAVFNAYNSLFGDPVAEINGDSATVIYNANNNPRLKKLQFNGGFTQTLKPKITSLAINAGDNAFAAAFTDDQRGAGFDRIRDTTVDIGAVEYQNISGGALVPQTQTQVMTRRDMAREIIKKLEANGYTPPPATGALYADVAVSDINADWIEEFKTRGFTEGCNNTNTLFCPNALVSREAVAKIFLKVKNGSAYQPAQPNINDLFVDVPLGSFHVGYITEMKVNGQTAGCDTNSFCPKEPVTQEWFNSLLSFLP